MWPFSRKKAVVEEPLEEAPEDVRSPLQKLQADMFAMVVRQPGAVAADAMVNGGALTADARVQIYAAMFQARTHDALKEDFPHTAKLLGEAFLPTVERYLAAFPSTHHSLGRLGHSFADFLKAERPDLADLARLEWARAESFVAIDVEPVSSDVPGQLGPAFGTAWLQVVPSFSLHTFAHDVATVWTTMEAGNEPVLPIAAVETHVVVWRKGFEVFHAIVSVEEARALQLLLERADVQTICSAFAETEDPAASAFQAIGSWFNESMIGAVRERPLADTFGM